MPIYVPFLQSTRNDTFLVNRCDFNFDGRVMACSLNKKMQAEDVTWFNLFIFCALTQNSPKQPNHRCHKKKASRKFLCLKNLLLSIKKTPLIFKITHSAFTSPTFLSSSDLKIGPPHINIAVVAHKKFSTPKHTG